MNARKEPHALPNVAGKYVHEVLELQAAGATEAEAIAQTAYQNGVQIIQVIGWLRQNQEKLQG